MDDAQSQLDTLKANNAADAAALTALETDLSTPATPSTGDQVLEAVVPVVAAAGLVEVFGADALVSALTAAGYAVSAPQVATQINVTDASDTEDSTDTSSDTTEA